jgi:hypothetical protein
VASSSWSAASANELCTTTADGWASRATASISSTASRQFSGRTRHPAHATEQQLVGLGAARQESEQPVAVPQPGGREAGGDRGGSSVELAEGEVPPA